MKNVILINGLPRAGKDTMADYLVQKYNYYKISFADELKDIVASVKKDITITPICEPRFDDYKKSIFGIKIKKLF